MLKIAAVVSLMLIGSTLWAAGLSCESCGRECASACGTRHFRACCFNYLRRKRVSAAGEFNTIWSSKPNEVKMEGHPKPSKKIPIFAIEDIEPWMNHIVSTDDLETTYQFENNIENRLPGSFDVV